MANRTEEVGKVDRNKSVSYMEFEHKTKSHTLTLEGNDLNEVWKRSVQLVRDEDLWDEFTLERVGKFG